MSSSEVERIRAAYARRDERIPRHFYSLSRAPNLFAQQQKSRWLLHLLDEAGAIPLDGKTIVDVGCGEGQQLIELESWGARREDLAGIDLLEARVARARIRLGGRHDSDCPGADLRVGDASDLPWPAGTFHIAYQGTVFTSITDCGMKKAIAGEIVRVLKPGGVLIWYDFLFNNPRNASVRGIGAREIRSLFPACSVRAKRITLAPPIARRLVPITWIGSLILEKLVILNTHYLAIIRKTTDGEQRSAPVGSL
jgi:ubiquinone/menaquinone biosynthesis C-methylase UbiE